jgi:hypothetical protein
MCLQDLLKCLNIEERKKENFTSWKETFLIDWFRFNLIEHKSVFIHDWKLEIKIVFKLILMHT